MMGVLKTRPSQKTSGDPQRSEGDPHTPKQIGGTNLRTHFIHALIYGRSGTPGPALQRGAHSLHGGDLLSQAGDHGKEPQVHESIGHPEVHHLQDLRHSKDGGEDLSQLVMMIDVGSPCCELSEVLRFF